MAFKIAHFVELNGNYYPAKFHWPSLSGSNFTRGMENTPPDLHALKKPSPYRVKQVCKIRSYVTCDKNFKQVCKLRTDVTCDSGQKF